MGAILAFIHRKIYLFLSFFLAAFFHTLSANFQLIKTRINMKENNFISNNKLNTICLFFAFSFHIIPKMKKNNNIKLNFPSTRSPFFILCIIMSDRMDTAGQKILLKKYILFQIF